MLIHEFMWQFVFYFVWKEKELIYPDRFYDLETLKTFSHFIVKKNMR